MGGGRRDVKSVTDAVELASSCPSVRPGFASHPAFDPVSELNSMNISDCQSMWLPLGQWFSVGGDFVPSRTCDNV